MIEPEFIESKLKGINSVTVRLHDEDWPFEIWPDGNLRNWNEQYEVQENIPGYFAIGSDGGGEMLAIKLDNGVIYSIPFIPMTTQEQIKVADSLEELIS